MTETMAPAAPPGAAAQAGEAGDEGSSPSSGQTRAAAPARRQGWLGRLIGRLRRGEGAGGAEPQAGSERPEALRSGGGLAALRSLRVSDVAVPRAEIVAVPVEIGLDGLVEVFRRSGYTRLPVYQRTLDHPLGMVHLKDVALRYGFNGGRKRFNLRRMLRPLLYVPPSMPVATLLQRMQAERLHMALVIDEYGGVDGLVTLEDLIEPVIGEIEDEHDVESGPLWQQEKPGVWLAQARAPLDEFERASGLSLAEAAGEEEVDTLGGLVFVLAGRVPARGEVVPHPAGVEFEVVDADPRRIKRLRICRADARKAA